MDGEFLVFLNMVGIVFLLFALNRLRYTVPITGKIIRIGSYSSYSSDSNNKHYLDIEYKVNEEVIKSRHSITGRSCINYRDLQNISLKILPNNPYKYIIVHDSDFFGIKFLLVSIIIIDIYEYLINFIMK